MSEIERESMPVDVLFVGGGPACLSGAIHLMGLIEKHNEGVAAGTIEGKPIEEPTIALIDKGSDELYAVACAAAIGELSKAVLPDKIKPITVSLSIEGDAILVDTKDGNRRADGLDLGQWHGTLAYPSTSLSLRRPDHVFTAERDTARSNNVER